MEFKDLLPIIIIQLTFQLAAIGHIIYKKRTRNLNVWTWAGIVIVAGVLGSILYFSLGRFDD